jgi:hypothetical protein
MLLSNQNAVIYGSCGVIGGAVARVFAREGSIPDAQGEQIMTQEFGTGKCGAGGMFLVGTVVTGTFASTSKRSGRRRGMSRARKPKPSVSCRASARCHD